jgi:DNA-binding beta-propeller fold protein YncE
MPVENGGRPEILLESPYEPGKPGGYYGLDVDPGTSEVYVSDALDHVQRGRVYRLNADGTPLDTFITGISPGAFCFKPPAD